jgi:hypothetical protein
MRTADKIDDDSLAAAEERASRERKTPPELAPVYGVRPFPPGPAVATNADVDALRLYDAY